MPAISEYELNADHHALYTRVSVQLYATDMLYEQIVVQGSHQRNVAIAQQLQALDAKVVEAIQRENPTVVTMCLHGCVVLESTNDRMSGKVQVDNHHHYELLEELLESPDIVEEPVESFDIMKAIFASPDVLKAFFDSPDFLKEVIDPPPRVPQKQIVLFDFALENRRVPKMDSTCKIVDSNVKELYELCASLDKMAIGMHEFEIDGAKNLEMDVEAHNGIRYVQGRMFIKVWTKIRAIKHKPCDYPNTFEYCG